MQHTPNLFAGMVVAKNEWLVLVKVCRPENASADGCFPSFCVALVLGGRFVWLCKCRTHGEIYPSSSGRPNEFRVVVKLGFS